VNEPVVSLASAKLGHGDHVVLDSVDLELAAGECMAIVGRSGAGKTTLLDALLGLSPPVAGSVQLFGLDLARLSADEGARLRQRLGAVFQRDALFRDITVGDNLALAPRMTHRLPVPLVSALVELKLEQVGLAGFAERMPGELSGGQQKRVAFARAVMLDPELLICDEPTSGLDALSSATIGSLIARLRSEIGSTIVLATHDRPLVRSIADRVVVIGGGGLLAVGTVAELASHANPEISTLVAEAK
jgi:phospholipid/cholesterol/gamma-HCH transport system ATP-binding protein